MTAPEVWLAPAGQAPDRPAAIDDARELTIWMRVEGEPAFPLPASYAQRLADWCDGAIALEHELELITLAATVTVSIDTAHDVHVLSDDDLTRFATQLRIVANIVQGLEEATPA